MANIKSQKKRILTNEKRRVRNKDVRSEVRTAVKKVHAAVEAGDKDTATTTMRHASRLYDKAATKGVYKKNHAANHKSQLARMVDRMDGSA